MANKGRAVAVGLARPDNLNRREHNHLLVLVRHQPFDEHQTHKGLTQSNTTDKKAFYRFLAPSSSRSFLGFSPPAEEWFVLVRRSAKGSAHRRSAIVLSDPRAPRTLSWVVVQFMFSGGSARGSAFLMVRSCSEWSTLPINR